MKLEDPPDAFCSWWYPHKRDNVSGADIGGHPDAERTWAKKTKWGWLRRPYGTSARTAWNTLHYRSEYEQWVALGRPDRDEPFVSLAASNERQLQFWRDLMPIYQWAFTGKSIPKAELDPLVEKMMREYPGYEPPKPTD